MLPAGLTEKMTFERNSVGAVEGSRADTCWRRVPGRRHSQWKAPELGMPSGGVPGWARETHMAEACKLQVDVVREGSAARSCQALDFYSGESETRKLWRFLSDMARLQNGDVYWEMHRLPSEEPFWDQWKGISQKSGEGKREVRVTSKALAWAPGRVGLLSQEMRITG